MIKIAHQKSVNFNPVPLARAVQSYHANAQVRHKGYYSELSKETASLLTGAEQIKALAKIVSTTLAEQGVKIKSSSQSAGNFFRRYVEINHKPMIIPEIGLYDGFLRILSQDPVKLSNREIEIILRRNLSLEQILATVK